MPVFTIKYFVLYNWLSAMIPFISTESMDKDTHFIFTAWRVQLV